MREVANSAVKFAVDHAHHRFGVDPEWLLRPIFSDPDFLMRNPRGRIPWVAFASIVDRLENAVGGRTAMQSFFDTGDLWKKRGLMGGIEGLFKDSRDLYGYAAAAVVPSHFANIECKCTEDLDGSVTLQAWVPIEFRDSPPFWWASASLLRILPEYIGQSDALVDPQISDRQAIYRITPPPPLTITARLRNSLRGFFALQSAADLAAEQGKELAQVHKTLVETRRRLEREISDASRQEQQRIARDLHDGLGQQLTVISLQAKLLEETLEDTAPELSSEVTQLLREIKDAAMLARKLSHSLDEIGSRARDQSTR